MTDQPRPPYYNPDHRRAREAAQQAAQQAADDAKRARMATLPRGNVVPVEEWTVGRVFFWWEHKRKQ